MATLVDADLLVILTDIDGLYTSDPRTNAEATLVPVVELIDSSIESMVGEHLNPYPGVVCSRKSKQLDWLQQLAYQ